tara:strand:- start:979 stop:1113 length:135 start_codon:yes stop_codon:yes gene_type:complete
MKMPSTKKAASKAFNGHNKGKSTLGCERCEGSPVAKPKKKKKAY